MITLKQLEALNWIAQLGTFERAAAKLNTSQSAISKRIQELETMSGLTVFDRNQRGARLTEQGEQLLALGRNMLAIQDQILDLRAGKLALTRRLRLGVTELCALTWMARFISAIRSNYPTVNIEPEVDMGRNLYERLLDGTLDLIIIPEAFSDPEITIVRLAEVENVWTARPNMVKGRRPIGVEEINSYTILTQGARSGSALYLNKWLRTNGVAFQRVISCDNHTAVVGLTVAGIGVSYLAKQCFRPLFKEGKLAVLSVKPALPLVPYAAMYRNDRPSAFASAIAELARSVCDFGHQLQG